MITSILGIRAMYKILHVEKGWIVCDGPTKLISFNRKSIAVRTVRNAQKLLQTKEAAQRKTAEPVLMDKLSIAS
jgi:hypothetical protein